MDGDYVLMKASYSEPLRQAVNEQGVGIDQKGGHMRQLRLFVVLLLLALGACASGGLGGPGAGRSGDVAGTMTEAMTTYRSVEQRLSAAQKEEFREACNHVSSAYRTAGILLASFFDAEDEASANTALVAYRTTMTELPKLADEAARLARSFKGRAK